METKIITLKPKDFRVEALCWQDNIPEMKHFALDQCRITYETCCEGGDYWNLQVYDDLRENWRVVPLGHYVVKLGPERFVILDPLDIDEFFTKE